MRVGRAAAGIRIQLAAKKINTESIYKKLKDNYIERYRAKKGEISPQEMAGNFQSFYADLGRELKQFVPKERQTAFAEIMEDFGFVVKQHQLFYRTRKFPGVEEWKRLLEIDRKSGESVRAFFEGGPKTAFVLHQLPMFEEARKNNERLAEVLKTNPGAAALLAHPATKHYRDNYEAVLLSMKIAAQQFRPLQHRVPEEVIKALGHVLGKLDGELDSIHEAIELAYGRRIT